MIRPSIHSFIHPPIHHWPKNFMFETTANLNYTLSGRAHCIIQMQQALIQSQLLLFVLIIVLIYYSYLFPSINYIVPKIIKLHFLDNFFNDFGSLKVSNYFAPSLHGSARLQPSHHGLRVPLTSNGALRVLESCLSKVSLFVCHRECVAANGFKFCPPC